MFEISKLVKRKLKVFYNKIPVPVRITISVILICILIFILIFILFDIIFPFRFNLDYSTSILDDKGQVIYAFLNNDDKWRLKTEIEEITPQMKKAILFKEDKYFYYHSGFNPVSIIRAALQNLRNKEIISGASTITMQVTRLLEPKKRSYRNKILEIFRAMQLEFHYSKNEILQIYLNLIPYGGNIEGVKAASLIYFNKLPNYLSIGEIAVLSVVPNNPNVLNPSDNTSDLLESRNKWLKKYMYSRLFSKDDILDAISEPISNKRYLIPRNIPQLAYRLKNRYVDIINIRTSIDFESQQKVEKMTYDHIQKLMYQNIKNAAVIVIENKTRNVKVYVGSPDFYNDEACGQIDGVISIRSPGSTLKPLIYGLGFDKGLITSKTVISDVPTEYSGYIPENYDGKYNGLINIEFALANSLNVPAVKVFNEIGISDFLKKAEVMNFDQLRKDKGKIGLSVALGGCGVTLEELAGMYCTFANKGLYGALRYTNNCDTGNIVEVISAQAAFILTEIMIQLTRPDLPLYWENSANLPKVAWKTGTSYGRRDAWSIGYNKNYTIGVWVGNFTGDGIPELTGSQMAAPLLFTIFNAIDYSADEDWFEMPDGLKFRYVCSESGNIPSDFCENQVMDYFIPGISSNKKCDHLKYVFINPDSTKSYCTSCLPSAGYIKALYPNLSPEIVTFYNDNNMNYLKMPPHNPDCERVFSGLEPVITSPVLGNDYYIDITDSMQVMLSCNAANDVEHVYWYINKKFYKKTLKNKPLFFNPTEGKLYISCSDDKGRNSDIWINVKKIDF